MESEYFVLTAGFCKKFARDYSIVIVCIEQVMAVYGTVCNFTKVALIECLIYQNFFKKYEKNPKILAFHTFPRFS